jgi:hypothetical protein
VSIEIPGLIVVDIKILFMYVPLEVDGFIFNIVLRSSSAFSKIFSAEKDALPMEA